ncbi:hypothetical protein HS088_TW13G01221 [Tripterygium wilfordii]|uniref:Uncharacterized protein n=1 Tax=Tripterygium wilfordii TaxID=458696 RepID=A0A7J7CW22_TRIWF|nr:hypothetical protein HS088_TW13G01221 [Tripterygium wilfordii]
MHILFPWAITEKPISNYINQCKTMCKSLIRKLQSVSLSDRLKQNKTIWLIALSYCNTHFGQNLHLALCCLLVMSNSTHKDYAKNIQILTLLRPFRPPLMNSEHTAAS